MLLENARVLFTLPFFCTNQWHLKVLHPRPPTPRRASNHPRLRAQPAICKSAPEIAEVLTSGKRVVGIDDGVARVDEGGQARLELHAVDDELEGERVAVLWHQRGCGECVWVERRRMFPSFRIQLLQGQRRAVERCEVGMIVDRKRGVFREGRGEERVGEAVCADELLGDGEEHFSPDFADGVRLPVGGRVESFVCRRVGGLVLCVDEVSGEATTEQQNRLLTSEYG